MVRKPIIYYVPVICNSFEVNSLKPQKIPLSRETMSPIYVYIYIYLPLKPLYDPYNLNSINPFVNEAAAQMRASRDRSRLKMSTSQSWDSVV